MARSQNTFNKKEREKKKLQKRKNKEENKARRKEQAKSSNLDDMLVYVDEFGNLVDTPPEEGKKTEEIDPESIAISTPKSAPVDMDAERRGTVKFYNENKGYGFIEQQGAKEQFFVHESNLIDPIRDNDKVKFKIEKGEKGFNAVKVQKLN